jgi:hypothetical protein
MPMHDPESETLVPPRASEAPPPEQTDATPTYPSRPWLTIWFRPTATIRAIVETDPTRYVFLLGVLSGLGGYLGLHIGRAFDLSSIMVVLVVGATYGLFLLYLDGFVMSGAGLWLGAAKPREVRSAHAWAMVPLVPLAPMACVVDLLPETPQMLYLLYGLSVVILVPWSLVLYIKCLIAVHRFSASSRPAP